MRLYGLCQLACQALVSASSDIAPSPGVNLVPRAGQQSSRQGETSTGT